jgi:hypothetical protein
VTIVGSSGADTILGSIRNDTISTGGYAAGTTPADIW